VGKNCLHILVYSTIFFHSSGIYHERKMTIDLKKRTCAFLHNYTKQD